MNIIVSLVIGGIVGWLAGKIMNSALTNGNWKHWTRNYRWNFWEYPSRSNWFAWNGNHWKYYCWCYWRLCFDCH